MEKVSVIIPVYNAGKYLNECVDSIINQTYSNLEIILIDDGSTDNSSIVCDEYKSIDDRIVVVHKKNAGVSAARNTGLDVATGKYVMFVDSDDYVDKHFVEKIVLNTSSGRIVVCGYTEMYKNCNTCISSLENIQIENNIINSFFSYPYIGGFCCNKIYLREIIDSNKIRFNEEIKFCEDLFFNLQYIVHIKNILVISDSLYYYRMRKSSTTWNLDENKINNLFYCFNKISDFLNAIDSITIEFLCFKLIALLKYNIFNIKKITLKDYKTVISSEQIPFKYKLKIFILRNFNFIYKLYMMIKLKRKMLFE